MSKRSQQFRSIKSVLNKIDKMDLVPLIYFACEVDFKLYKNGTAPCSSKSYSRRDKQESKHCDNCTEVFDAIINKFHSFGVKFDDDTVEKFIRDYFTKFGDTLASAVCPPSVDEFMAGYKQSITYWKKQTEVIANEKKMPLLREMEKADSKFNKGEVHSVEEGKVWSDHIQLNSVKFEVWVKWLEMKRLMEEAIQLFKKLDQWRMQFANGLACIKGPVFRLQTLFPDTSTPNGRAEMHKMISMVMRGIVLNFDVFKTQPTVFLVPPKTQKESEQKKYKALVHGSIFDDIQILRKLPSTSEHVPHSKSTLATKKIGRYPYGKNPTSNLTAIPYSIPASNTTQIFGSGSHMTPGCSNNSSPATQPLFLNQNQNPASADNQKQIFQLMQLKKMQQQYTAASNPQVLPTIPPAVSGITSNRMETSAPPQVGYCIQLPTSSAQLPVREFMFPTHAQPPRMVSTPGFYTESEMRQAPRYDPVQTNQPGPNSSIHNVPQTGFPRMNVFAQPMFFQPTGNNSWPSENGNVESNSSMADLRDDDVKVLEMESSSGDAGYIDVVN